ncbi:MAG: radical SAM protein [Candidatus Bathyarchaeota archaeon]|nr:MAG: radical SAM protein [Candidatus Bathyarchaeota archaeon]
MSENLPEMPYLRNIGLIVTYKCQVACPHCIIEAGPKRKEALQPETAQNWIEQIANYRNGYIKVLSLTGGEPFYNICNLQQISSMGEENGLLVSAVTNAFWAITPKKAIDILQNLPAIKMLAISADAYHQKEIPFERVQNAVHAAKKLDIPFQIAVCTENHDDPEYKKIVQKLEEITDSEKIKTAITFPVGRAQKLNKNNYSTSKVPPVSACSAGSSPIIFPNGNIIGCIGPVINIKTHHPLLLGNLNKKPLEEILNLSEKNPIYHAIRIWGPQKLISMANEAGLSKHLPTEYVENSICHACYNLLSNDKIRSFLGTLANDFVFQRKVAYARLYYLRENQMFDRMKPELLRHELLRA